MMPDPGPLYLPDVTGMTLAQAALAYAVAGWYVLPTDPGDIKNPGSVVGGRWCEKSSRDPAQIRRWWAENPRYGIALHVGRSGAVAFDFDCYWLVVIDEAGRPDIAEALRSAGAINGTAIEGDRAGYLFACEPNEFSNSAGAFARWGQVRGTNGVIIVAPTPHPAPEREPIGGCYRQIKTGPLAPVPDVLRAALSEVADRADPLSCAGLDAFLDDNDAVFGCEHPDCANTPAGPVAKFTAKVAKGASRHDTMCHDVLPWAFREAIAGCYPAREAYDALRGVWGDATAGEYRTDEFARMAAWAAAQAQADPGSDDDTASTVNTDRPRLWRATELRPAAQPVWLAKGRLPRGEVSLLVGDEGIGKSLLWVWLAGPITTGKAAPEFGMSARDPGHVVVVVTEDSWCTQVRTRLEAAGADLTMVSVLCTDDDGSGAPVFPRDLDVIAAAEQPPALVVVDARLDTVAGGLKVREPQDARKALHPFKELAQTTGAAVLLITHTNRDKSADARDRYGITGELRKKARMTLYAQQDDKGRLIVGPEKMNATRPLPASKFVIEPVQWFAPSDDDDGTVPVLRYVGDSDRTAREHVRDTATKGAGTDGGDDPRELWLYKYLTFAADAGVAVKPKDAVAAARDEQGISRATLFRHFAALVHAGLAEVIDSGSFPRSTLWQIVTAPDPGETTGDGETTA